MLLWRPWVTQSGYNVRVLTIKNKIKKSWTTILPAQLGKKSFLSSPQRLNGA